nr:hypothetical protein B0A51_13929 [Rachicladosporium sp. CCFEE 5018]
MATSTTMTRPARPSLAPPSGPLPALPVPKTRSQLSDIADVSEDHTISNGDARPTPPPKPMRSVTHSGLPTPRSAKSHSTPAVPTLSTGRPPPSPSPPISSLRTLRKTTSIGQFPLPPKGTSRVSSLPPSPLSTSESTSDLNGVHSPKKQRVESGRTKSFEGGQMRQKTPRSSGYGLRARVSTGAISGSHTPTLLNGSGENSFISSAEGARGSYGFLNLPSPPLSRTPSMDGSCHTEGTTFEDVDGDANDRGRQKSIDSVMNSKRSSGAGKDTGKGSVLVSVRVRPDAGSGEAEQAEGEWVVDGRRSLVTYRGKEGGDYRYDNVFSPHDNNSRVYDNAAKRLVRRVMEGYNGTVFAYGMTGTGKTFSMQGTAISPGVIPLAITDIFSYIRENPSREFLLRVSYLEIYNEKIFDLLNQATPGSPAQEEIKLREDSKRGVYATPLREEIVQSPNQLLRVISRGDLARRTSSTQFNARSSRSHAVVQIVVESRERAPAHGAYFEKESRRADRILPGGVLVSTLSLIDLAGSERAAESKERRTEGSHINKSLLTLGTVIGRLSGEDDKEKDDPTKKTEKEKSIKHLPYRDSKLTRLLQPALSGDSLVSILCTIQLSSAATSAATTGSHTGETLNTLKFASRAKNNIVSHAKKNESNPSGDAGSRALLDRYRLEIQDLRSQLEAQNKAKEEVEEKDEIEMDRQREEEMERQEKTRHEEQMLEMQLARTALKERISHLNRLILSSKSLGVNSSGRFSSASVPMHRVSLASNRESTRSGSSHSRERDSMISRRESAATLDMPMPTDSSAKPFSTGSITVGVMPPAQASQMISEDPAMEDEEGFDSSGPKGDGEATVAQQNRMLQADLADKNRYIATLEKRLLQARRTSHSRISKYGRMSIGLPEESTLEAALQEKDKELAELRAKLDDQIRMVQALRSATRKRETLEGRRSSFAVTERVAEDRPTSAASMPLINGHSDYRSQLSSRASNRQSRHGVPGSNNSISHRSNPSTASANSATQSHSTTKPLSPVALLSNGTVASPTKKFPGFNLAESKSMVVTSRRRSVDEMTALLDQMIADKVESGHAIRSERGSLRVKRDTVMDRGSVVKGETLHEDGEEDEGSVD